MPPGASHAAELRKRQRHQGQARKAHPRQIGHTCTLQRMCRRNESGRRLPRSPSSSVLLPPPWRIPPRAPVGVSGFRAYNNSQYDEIHSCLGNLQFSTVRLLSPPFLSISHFTYLESQRIRAHERGDEVAGNITLQAVQTTKREIH